MAYLPNEHRNKIISKLKEIVEGKKMTIVELAAIKAKEWHRATNHLYDGKDYFDAHLEPVAVISKKFLSIIPFVFWEIVQCGAYLHDSVEDARKSYNDVKKVFGFHIAEIVFALTNDKGRTRHERAGWRYYFGIRKVKFARYDKLCDRIQNVIYSKTNKSSMFNVYRAENNYFVNSLKGTNTWFGKVRHWIKTKLNLHEADYTIMYNELERLFHETEYLGQ